MNAQNLDNKPKVKKESKNKIKVEFDRTPLKERLKAKFLSSFFFQKLVWWIVRLVLLIGISYIVLFPFFSKIAGSFMAAEDFVDVTVRLIPKHFTLDTYKAVIVDLGYFEAFLNTFLLSLSTALIQTFICSFIAYGLAKFKFKGNKLVFLLVIFSLVVPHQTLKLSLIQSFKYFDILGIFNFLSGRGITIFGQTIVDGGVFDAINIFPKELISSRGGINLLNTYWPFIILSFCGLAFKNGLYIFMLRQFFKGVPDELEESAYIDGSGVINTFFKIILPISVPMMITVFLFSFSWQWTDDFYLPAFMPTSNTVFLSRGFMGIPASLDTGNAGKAFFESAIKNTCGLMIILPLIIMYLFCQNYLVQGIERSGLTAD